MISPISCGWKPTDEVSDFRSKIKYAIRTFNRPLGTPWLSDVFESWFAHHLRRIVPEGGSVTCKWCYIPALILLCAVWCSMMLLYCLQKFYLLSKFILKVFWNSLWNVIEKKMNEIVNLFKSNNQIAPFIGAVYVGGVGVGVIALVFTVYMPVFVRELDLVGD